MIFIFGALPLVLLLLLLLLHTPPALLQLQSTGNDSRIMALNSLGGSTMVARFLAAKYGRLMSIRDVCHGQYDAISSQTKSPLSHVR